MVIYEQNQKKAYASLLIKLEISKKIYLDTIIGFKTLLNPIFDNRVYRLQTSQRLLAMVLQTAAYMLIETS